MLCRLHRACSTAAAGPSAVVHNTGAAYLQKHAEVPASFVRLCSERLKVARQSTLRVRDASAPSALAKVEVFPTWWEDEVLVEVYRDSGVTIGDDCGDSAGSGGEEGKHSLPVGWAVHDGELTISAAALPVKEDSPSPYHLRVMIPTYFDLNVQLKTGDIHVHDKVEGNLQVLTTGGSSSVRIHKLRGPDVEICSGSGGGVRVGSAVEGRLKISGGVDGVQGKLFMGPTADIETPGTVDVAAFYCAQAEVLSSDGGDVVLGTVQGSCDVTATRGRVEAGSVTGSLRATAGGAGGIKAHFDVLSGHNVLEATDSVSGNVSVSIAAPVTVNLALSAAAGSSGVRMECPDGAFRKLEGDSEVGSVSSACMNGRLVLLDNGLGDCAPRVGSVSGSGKITHAGRAKAATEAAEAAADSGATLEATARGRSGEVSVRVLSWVQMMQDKIGLSRSEAFQK